MKKLFFLKAFTMLAFAFLVTSVASAQDMGGKKKPSSPRDTVSGTVGGASVTIAYGSPSARGRKIFGGLVPYDKAWRLGANQVTIIQTSADIKVEGKTLPAGKYSVFATPGEKQWIITFNSVTNQWGIKDDGSANDDPSKDVLSVTVKSMKSEAFTEALTFKIDPKGFVILWENVAVPVKIK
ncbi:DUF2911 domain-containing protein [Mucilaginibacter sp. X4EP1]|jgi:hypothetical protein|uniref:DUF2911 domain-containing protein n=1 Tax=Mucilaginibacter sp. X4EP1 TaxID=2723092 RepID=UPI002169D235|nr:DUF2911 domain-containing protein [Mucilaginibacter sp. X4EP1]MCS3815209.1 hypothetical protein [Mucilaginibacter sp. X4EP1]